MLNMIEKRNNQRNGLDIQEHEELMKELMDIYTLDSEWGLVNLYYRVKINEEAAKQMRLIRKHQKIKLEKAEQCRNVESMDSFFEQDYIAQQGLTLDGFIEFLMESKKQYQLYQEKPLGNLLD